MQTEATAAFSGDRLRLARFRAGLTIKDLAERVGVTHSAISQYETGRTRPTSVTLSKLAMATGVTPGFFRFDRRPVSSGGLDGTHFRSLRSTTKTVRSTAWAWSELALDVSDVLERYVRFPPVDLPEKSLTSGEDIVEAAGMLRDHWKLPEGPVGSLVRHMEAHGILVTRAPTAAEGVDAFSHFQGRRPIVVLGPQDKDAGRSRFDAAHELGHLICHPEADPGGSQEQQAHAFAAELLMPHQHMIDLLPRRFDLGAYARLKHEWGVSIAALLYRAKTLSVISDAAYRRAVVTMNKNYGRKDEPFPLPRTEQPKLLRSAISLITSTGRSVADLANEISISLQDLNSIAGGLDSRPVAMGDES
ncbi:helix-turn-helix domain-containing protein [Arthrobacter koreensis]|uniref:helix-turn-helix domain-containing protein n=2 Tax=Arthrobacter koreensis TaxID=199136 RepID=UPI001263FBB7|nr:XRE family transcriptional regulator [Arthrobacter koreensis]